jgi:Calpain family cysteine protease
LVVSGIVTQTVQAEAPKPSSSPFAKIVLAHFEEWDLNHNGILEPEELDRLVTKRSIQGDVAAALGTLKSIQRRGYFNLPKLDMEYFNTYAQLAAAKKLKGQPPFEGQFNAARKRIAASDRVVFPPGQPNLSAIHQGSLGDCFFLAGLGSMLARDPASIKQLIILQKNGDYAVRFPGTKTIHVSSLTDAELALTSTTEGHGLWLNLLEKAYGQLQNESLQADKKTLCTTDAICKGGSPRIVLQDLTAHQAKRMDLHPTSKVTVPAEKIADELHLLLVTTIQSRRLLCVDTLSEQKAKNLPAHHAYAVLNYDSKTRTIYLFNPHGNTFEPKGEPGLRNGYSTKQGRFAMPLAEFIECYWNIYYETSEPLKK